MGYDLDWLDEKGLCHKCGSRQKFPGRQYCPECLEKIAEINAKKYSPEKAHEYQARRRELYRQKKASGICVRCTKPATHGLYCYEHSIEAKRHSMQNSERRRNQRHDRGLVPEIRKQHNLCYWCGAPATGDTLACDKHRAICSASGKKLHEVNLKNKNNPWINEVEQWKKVHKRKPSKNS